MSNASDITLRLGSLLLDMGNGDQVHIDNFNQHDVYNSVAIDSFEFADGTTLSSAAFLARGFDIDGTEQNDTLTGTNITDRMHGLGGNDVLRGGSGDDELNGGGEGFEFATELIANNCHSAWAEGRFHSTVCRASLQAKSGLSPRRCLLSSYRIRSGYGRSSNCRRGCNGLRSEYI